MKSFSLVGQLGPDDILENRSIQREDSDVYRVDFLESNFRPKFGIGDALEELVSFGLQPSEKALDLVVLAALVNAADNKISRKDHAHNRWTREIDLYVPVSEPVLWRDCATHIGAMLRFLTGDRWRVIFRPRTTRVEKLVAYPLQDSTHGNFTSVNLLSGGLDSLIGAIDQLGTSKFPLFVSHFWDSETKKSQDLVHKNLDGRFGSQMKNKFQIKLGFDKNDLYIGNNESSQRGRSFLFYSLATLAASSLPKPAEIHIPENGLIALNVPLDWLRLGTLSTRTAHPHFLSCMGHLAEMLGINVTYSNPYRHKTKGEMVADCADGGFLKKIVGNSMSCSAPAKSRWGKKSPGLHCGYCVPCLIRRAALEAGLGTDDPTEYDVDVLSETLDSELAKGRHVRSFQLIADKIGKKPGLAKFLVRGTGPLGSDRKEIKEYENVFRRGILELGRFLRDAKAVPRVQA